MNDKFRFSAPIDVFAEQLVVLAAPEDHILHQNRPDPTEGLTFNLRLTEQEREKKEAMILPFQKHLSIESEEQGRDSSLAGPSSSSSPSALASSGAIYLDADDEDFDEFSSDDDDPDDDLDI